MRPLVAVPADRNVWGKHYFHMVGEKYLRAVIDGAGALPMVLPVLAEDLNNESLLEHFDGIMLTGSLSNVEPRHYGGSASLDASLHDTYRDAVTLPLAIRTLEAGVPLFAVCRGFQELNVALGGSLHQDVSQVDGYHNHRENDADPLDVQYGPSHSVSFTDGGLLQELAGSATAMVNSLHSQGVDRLADGLEVEAVADDGLVEAFRVVDAPGFNLAVQWHPEWQVTHNELSMAMYGAFGDACRERASRRQV